MDEVNSAAPLFATTPKLKQAAYMKAFAFYWILANVVSFVVGLMCGGAMSIVLGNSGASALTAKLIGGAVAVILAAPIQYIVFKTSVTRFIFPRLTAQSDLVPPVSDDRIINKYSIGGVIIGGLQVIDATVLYAHKGAAQAFSLSFAVVEFAWAAVSLIVVFRTKDRFTRLLAIAFFGYCVAGSVASLIIMDRSKPTTIPSGYVLAGGVFGLIYGLISWRLTSKS